jgi:hypothetical protein
MDPPLDSHSRNIIKKIRENKITIKISGSGLMEIPETKY